ncbi:MAG: hypothetical protein MZV70_67360 [Desulfobacterales bacterium]|nr:hypothetical protein [Desulfobacterales bacterium]
MDAVNLRLSNLMAFHATARGNWGCVPEHYPRGPGSRAQRQGPARPVRQDLPAGSDQRRLRDGSRPPDPRAADHGAVTPTRQKGT